MPLLVLAVNRSSLHFVIDFSKQSTRLKATLMGILLSTGGTDKQPCAQSPLSTVNHD